MVSEVCMAPKGVIDHSASPSADHCAASPSVVPDASPVSTIDLSNIPDDDTLSEYCCNGQCNGQL